MTYSKIEQLERTIKIAHLYYDKKYSQQTIAGIMHIDRTEISRILKYARQQGIVKTVIMPPSDEKSNEIARIIQKRFKIKEVIIAPTEKTNMYSNELEILSIYADEVLNNTITDNSVIGLSWGATIQKIVKNFTPKRNFKNIKIVPLIGSPLGKLDIRYQANDIVSRLSSKIINSEFSYLDSPVFINSEESKNLILETATNKRTTQLWNSVNIAIVGIGSANFVDSKNWREFYKLRNTEKIYHQTMIGDVLSQSFSLEGNEYQKDYPNLVGLSLNKLRKIPLVLGVAAGAKKAEAVYGGLSARLFDILIITDTLANKIISII